MELWFRLQSWGHWILVVLVVLGTTLLVQLGPGLWSRLGGLEEEVVVKIQLTRQLSDWHSPWQKNSPGDARGSGFVIGKGQVLTNAHVVSDARQVLVYDYHTGVPTLAEVEYIAHDSDLALLKVSDESFAKGVSPLPFGGLPILRSRVRTYGFPAGGTRISRTEGIVSRVQFWNYVHSGADAHIAVQTDSAVNPGNSGGPVVQNGKVVGVAFQSNRELNDVGYFIPTTVIKRFLKDIKDGQYDGYTELGAITSTLHNKFKRAFLGLKEQQTGVVVNNVLPGSSGEGYLQTGDVILEVEGATVDNEGTIAYEKHRVAFEQKAEEKLNGEEMNMLVLREGQLLKLSIPMKSWSRAPFQRRRYENAPRYLIFAGLVFMPLERELFHTSAITDEPHLLYAHSYQPLEDPSAFPPDQPLIVLTRILPHAINTAYSQYEKYIISRINGQPVRTLKDIATALDTSGDKLELTLNPGSILVVFNRDEADKAHLEMLKTYNINQDRRL